MLSLKNICTQNIAETIYSLPPQTRDMLLEESKAIIEQKIKQELLKEITQSIKDKIYKDILEDITIIAPEIFKDILDTMRFNNRRRKNYEEIYRAFTPQCINASVKIAESIVNSMEDEDIFTSHVDFSDRQIQYDMTDMYDTIDIDSEMDNSD